MNSNITKRKRLLSILTALMLVLAMAAALPPQEVWGALIGETFSENNLTYTIIDEHNVTLTGYKNAVPADLTIPDGVRDTEGNYYNVTAIGDGAFSGCSKLTSIVIPGSVTSIGRSVFYNCTSLTSINIPSSVTSIAPDAFYLCTSLENITVAEQNEKYAHSDGILFNNDKTELVRYPAGKTATTYEVPKGVTSIGDYAFERCQSLESIVIPDGITYIGIKTFETCEKLTSIVILGSVNSIGASAFSGCTSLASINIPGSVNSIGDSAFSDCTSLASINIPGSVTTIGDSAFSGCSSLASIAIPSSVTSIGDGAFADCNKLESITIPNTVASIGFRAFSNIPEGATVLVVFDEAADAAKEISSKITSAISTSNWYRGFRTFNTAANPIVLTLEQNKEYDLKAILGITDTVYKDTTGAITDPVAKLTLPFTLSGNSSTATTITTDGILTTAADETGPLTIDTCARTIRITREGPYIPPAIYYTLMAADLTFPDLAQGDAPSSLPLSISCTGTSGTSITRVVLDSTDFILDDSAAETYVGAGKTNDTYRIIPREGLAPGTYQAALTITYGYGRTATAKVTLTVTKAYQAPPTGLKVSSKSYRSAALSWKKADRAEKYQVYRAASKDSKYRLLYTTAKTKTTNTGLTCGKKYYYKIRAYRTVDGKKVYSKFTAPKAVTIRPSAPSFTLKAGTRKMTVTWKGVSGASGYRIYRASSKNGKYTLVKDSAGKARTYTSTRLKAGRTYYYKMRTYRMVNGKKVYSAYTAVQKKTTK